MTSMPYPSYGNIEVISKSLLLKDLSTMKDAVEKIEEIEIDKEKTISAVLNSMMMEMEIKCTRMEYGDIL